MRALLAAISLASAAVVFAESDAQANRHHRVDGGVDCATIRKLTTIERWYWIRRLGLSAADIHAIKTKCEVK